MRPWLSWAVGIAFAAAPSTAQRIDPANPSCPLNVNWPGSEPMHFAVQQGNGHEVLVAEGRIDAEMLPRLQQALDNFHGAELWLRSSGGDLRAAEDAGLMVRQSGLATRVPSDWICARACAYMFLGGTARGVDSRGLIIMQMFTLTNDSRFHQLPAAGPDRDQLLDEVAVYSAQQATIDNDYMLRMGISRRLLSEIAYRQPAVATRARPATRHCLTRAEMREYNVVTGD